MTAVARDVLPSPGETVKKRGRPDSRAMGRADNMKKFCVGLVSGLLLPACAFAGAYADLAQVRAAFFKATSWHIEEHLGGKTMEIDYSAPDRWRFVPAPNIKEVLIGNDVYMVTNGHVMTLPPAYGTMVAQAMRRAAKTDPFSGVTKADMEKTARDLGMQTLDGKSVHVYSCVVRGVDETLYVGADHLPVRVVMNGVRIKGHRVKVVADYSQFNQPITIEPPTS